MDQGSLCLCAAAFQFFDQRHNVLTFVSAVMEKLRCTLTTFVLWLDRFVAFNFI
jgi:hypothetical protein